MKHRFPSLAAILLLTTPAFAGWEYSLHTYPDHHERAVVSKYTEPDRGVATLDEVLKHLKEAGNIDKLDFIGFFGISKEDVFQKEIFQTLEQIAPKELSAAKRSAGNMHNPRMLDLHGGFKKAVLATPTVKAMNASLAQYGFTITSVGHEKLSLEGEKENRRFYCFLTLSISPLRSEGQPK